MNACDTPKIHIASIPPQFYHIILIILILYQYISLKFYHIHHNIQYYYYILILSYKNIPKLKISLKFSHFSLVLVHHILFVMQSPIKKKKTNKKKNRQKIFFTYTTYIKTQTKNIYLSNYSVTNSLLTIMLINQGDKN